MKSSGVWRWLGRAPFEGVAREQQRLGAALASGEGVETLLTCEHEPVITLGRASHPTDLRVSARELERTGIALVTTNRGGRATYHGPGQLVGYPVVRLRSGVLEHVLALARAVAAVLAEMGIEARFRRDAPGLWVADAKICALGVHVHRRITTHGFALNVTTSLDRFQLIVPCGMPDARVTSVSRLLAGRSVIPSLHVLSSRVAHHLGAALGTTLLPHIVRPLVDECGTREARRTEAPGSLRPTALATP